MEKRIIVVLGMPRSGARVLTRGLRLLGIELGDFLKPGRSGNPEEGLFEDEHITHLNEEIFRKMGKPWNGGLDPVDRTQLLDGSLKQEMERASQILSERTQSTEIFGFKDTRTTVLLPFWKAVFKQLELDDSYLIALRNPSSVADSFQAS